MAVGRRLSVATDDIRAAGVAVYEQARAYHGRAQAIQQVAIDPAVLDRQWAIEQETCAGPQPRPDPTQSYPP